MTNQNYDTQYSQIQHKDTQLNIMLSVIQADSAVWHYAEYIEAFYHGPNFIKKFTSVIYENKLECLLL
jgi:hypothetical protein